MSETAAAPAAPVANGTAPRNNAGQFAPKAGATGVVPQGESATTSGTGAPPAGPTTIAEWEGYEGEVEVYGERVPVKVKSKAEALRAHQELMAYRKRVRDIAEAEKRIAAREAAGPDENLITERARQKVIDAAKMVDMTPEQQRIHALEQELTKRDQAQQAETERQQQQETAQRRAQARRVAVEGLEKGLEVSGLPRTMHVMALLAEIQQECADQRMPPLPAELLAAEANKRYNERGIEPLRKLQGKALLDRIGPEVVRAVLLAERERRGLAAGAPRAASVVVERETPPPESDTVFDEAEANRRLRALRNS